MNALSNLQHMQAVTYKHLPRLCVREALSLNHQCLTRFQPHTAEFWSEQAREKKKMAMKVMKWMIKLPMAAQFSSPGLGRLAWNPSLTCRLALGPGCLHIDPPTCGLFSPLPPPHFFLSLLSLLLSLPFPLFFLLFSFSPFPSSTSSLLSFLSPPLHFFFLPSFSFSSFLLHTLLSLLSPLVLPFPPFRVLAIPPGLLCWFAESVAFMRGEYVSYF